MTEEPVFRQARYPFKGPMEEAERRQIYDNPLPDAICRDKSPAIPDVPEHDIVRHYTRLSQMNFGIDSGFYPLGSCTMKYNPKYSKQLASDDRAHNLHPYQPSEHCQGTLQMMYELQEMLAEIGGMDSVSLQPAAGAQGEITGLMIADAYHKSRKEKRHEVILPDTAHGTNPASVSMMGYDLIEIPSQDGCVDLEALEEAAGEDTAAFMLTNPNTLGLFEEDVEQIADILHDAGALLYYDGANLNAIMGKAKPGTMDFDIMHFNLHKTFSTPHGGGGPGSGPVGVSKRLSSFLPVPIVAKDTDEEKYYLEYDLKDSIGKVKDFYGNWIVLLKAYSYIIEKGSEGITEVAERSVLNSNYLRKKLEQHLEMPYSSLRKHEFVMSGAPLKDKGLKTVDLAKRLLDYGFHSPTIYFPQLVDESLMIEPTETESKETLDRFSEVIGKIMDEEPDIIHNAPYNTAVKRVDETKAARDPVISLQMRDK